MAVLNTSTAQSPTLLNPVSPELFAQMINVAARTVILTIPPDSMGLRPAVVTPRDERATPSNSHLVLNSESRPKSNTVEEVPVPVPSDCGMFYTIDLMLHFDSLPGF